MEIFHQPMVPLPASLPANRVCAPRLARSEKFKSGRARFQNGGQQTPAESKFSALVCLLD
jgi:hypothetical protein